MSINKKDSTSWFKKSVYVITSWFKKSIYVINDIINVFFKKRKVWEPDTKELSIYINTSKSRGSIHAQTYGDVINYEDLEKRKDKVFKSNTVFMMLKNIKRSERKNIKTKESM